jgi:transcriptional regulator with XRE-family HTH domain
MEQTSVGRMVRWARKRADMTQVELAQASGMAQSAVARIERGSVVPRATTLISLLRATGYELGVHRTIGAGVDPEPILQRLRLSNPDRTRRALGTTRDRPGPIRILRRLRRFGVRFVLIGPLAETAHGAPGRIEPVVEICHSLDPVNLERLATALADIGADAPDASKSADVMTTSGRLLLEPEPVTGDGFEVLARNATRMLVDIGLLVPVAALDDLIQIRRSRGQPEDREVLEVLGAVRDHVDAAPSVGR